MRSLLPLLLLSSLTPSPHLFAVFRISTSICLLHISIWRSPRITNSGSIAELIHSWESFGQQGDKPVNPKENQPRIFIGRTDAEAEAPILWPPDVNNWLIGKDTDAGEDQGQQEKRLAEDEMVGWHHRLNGRKFEQTLGDSDGQGSLVCSSPWGRRVKHD